MFVGMDVDLTQTARVSTCGLLRARHLAYKQMREKLKLLLAASGKGYMTSCAGGRASETAPQLPSE